MPHAANPVEAEVLANRTLGVSCEKCARSLTTP